MLNVTYKNKHILVIYIEWKATNHYFQKDHKEGHTQMW